MTSWDSTISCSDSLISVRIHRITLVATRCIVPILDKANMVSKSVPVSA